MSELPENHRSHYQILRLPPNAEQKQIKRSYHSMLLENHPDKSANVLKNITINEIQNAYKILSNSTLRKNYDEKLHAHYTKKGVSDLSIDGIDEISLDKFESVENLTNNEWEFFLDCPRCCTGNGFKITETQLSYGMECCNDHHNESEINKYNNNDPYYVLVQCSSCSLWLSVIYFECNDAN